MEGSRPYDFHKPLPGVFLLQLSQSYMQETQLLICSLLGLQREVPYLVIAFSLLRCAKTLHRAFSPHSRQGACQTVPAVPVLLALP